MSFFRIYEEMVVEIIEVRGVNVRTGNTISIRQFKLCHETNNISVLI